jgi:thioredoxin-related protein
MKNLIIVLFLMIAGQMLGYSQVDSTKGIAFERGLTWQEVLQKAKIENKFVFIDCYTTWCGPCRLMDQQVYINDSIGTFINAHYISIRLQMDKTDEDNPQIKSSHKTADFVHQKYNIGSYPTFLFFSPDGRLVHREGGFKRAKVFLNLAKAAMDPTQQYYTLLANYQEEKKNYALLPNLARAAINMGQDSLAKMVVREYLNDCLDKLSDSEFLTRSNILFLHQNCNFVSPEDHVFRTYYENRVIIDSIMHYHGFANIAVDFIIYENIIAPVVKQAAKAMKEPNWHQLENRLALRYNVEMAKKLVLEGRINFYSATREWSDYSKYYIRQQKQNGIEKKMSSFGSDATNLNNSAYEVFQYSSKRRELKEALEWVNRAIKVSASPYPDAMDTKANLLYKLGKTAEGLALEQRAHELAPRNKDISTNYEKMKIALPTRVTK